MAAIQRRGRRIMMTDADRDAYLAEQRTCRVATVSADGRPHVGALWFTWDGTSLWLYSITRSLRWSQLRQDPRIAVVVDDGVEYGELRGVELSGEAVPVAEAPAPANRAPNSPFRSDCSRRSTSQWTPCRTTAATPGCG